MKVKSASHSVAFLFLALCILFICSSCDMIFDFFNGDTDKKEKSENTGKEDSEDTEVEVGPDPTDLDGDGLSNEDELLYKTNPNLADTDGDGYTDGEEINKYQFNPDVNPYKFNPRIADMPKVSVTLESLPDIDVIYMTSEGTSESVSYDHGSETGTSKTTDKSSSQSRSYEHSAGITLGVEHTFGLAKGGTTLSAELNYQFTAAFENSTSFSVSETSEKRETYNECKAYEQSHEYSEANGELGAIAKISNAGDIAFTVKSLYLGAKEFDPADPGSLEPICTMNRAGSDGFQEFSLAPGASSELGYSGDMNLDETHHLLRDAQNLVVEVETCELVDENGKAYVHNTTEIGAKTASVAIDYGPGIKDGANNFVLPEKHLVATNLTKDSPGITLAYAMEDILLRSYEVGDVQCTQAEGGSSVILRKVKDISGTGAQSGDGAGYWVVVHSGKRSGDSFTDWYTPLADYSLADITLHAGDNVLLIYTKDEDGDGLTARQELSWGTDDTMVDSDGDGTSDYDEVQAVLNGDTSVAPAIAGEVNSDTVDPDTASNGATLFQHAGYSGGKKTFTANASDLADHSFDNSENIDNNSSSLAVNGGYRVALFSEPFWHGIRHIFTAHETNFRDIEFNDMVSSLCLARTDNLSNLGFDQIASTNVGFQAFEDLAVGDVSDSGGKGIMEIVYANEGNNTFYVYQRNGASLTTVATFDVAAVFGNGVKFIRAELDGDTVYGDRIACGDFQHGDYLDEILFMDFPGTMRFLQPRGATSRWDFAYGTEAGDSVAAGNLDGNYPGWEFAVAHREDKLRTRYPNNNLVLADRNEVFGSGDQMAIGELTGDNQSEIILIRHDFDGSSVGEFRIYSSATGNDIAYYRPPVDIHPWDSISTADVDGDGIDELIWGTRDAGSHGIRILSWNGSNVTIVKYYPCTFNEGDRIVAGDVDGDGTDEIIHGCSSGFITVYKIQ